MRAGRALSSLWVLIRAGSPVLAVAWLAGCAAVAIAPAVPIANGAREDKINISLDEATLTPAVRNTLLRAKRVGLVVSEPWAIKLADLLEARGGYSLAIERPKAKVSEMTATERRETLHGMCGAGRRTDIAVLGRITRVQTGNASMATLTGRTSIKNSWSLDILSCRSHTTQTVGGGFDLDVSTANAKSPAELDEKMGVALADKVLMALGK